MLESAFLARPNKLEVSNFAQTQLYQPTYPYAWQSLQKAQKIAVIRFKFSLQLASRTSSR